MASVPKVRKALPRGEVVGTKIVILDGPAAMCLAVPAPRGLLGPSISGGLPVL